MPSNGFSFADLDGDMFPLEPIIAGGLALHEAFACISKFAGTLILLAASRSNSALQHNLSGNPHGSKPRGSKSRLQVKHITSWQDDLTYLRFGLGSRVESAPSRHLGKLFSSTMRHILNEVEQLRSFPVLSLAAAVVPPLDNLSVKAHAGSLRNAGGVMDQRPCMVHRGSFNLSFQEFDWKKNAVEPQTGIKFPTMLENDLTAETNYALQSEVLVGTGSKTMRIIKLKSLKVYAFGLYVHPESLCEKFGHKYASMPISELVNHPYFLQELLREDIDMTVRLVVNCNGLKINTVRDAFEKSLRARLLKMNPDTDYSCLRTFDSYFNQDIPLPTGTTIDFRRTVDGRLITKSRLVTNRLEQFIAKIYVGLFSTCTLVMFQFRCRRRKRFVEMLAALSVDVENHLWIHHCCVFFGSLFFLEEVSEGRTRTESGPSRNVYKKNRRLEKKMNCVQH